MSLEKKKNVSEKVKFTVGQKMHTGYKSTGETEFPGLRK